ncbi:MAG: ABC transporter permease [Chitinispirillia bacterium]|jgi:D-methionine transport system permease protein|nr:ABC transporter permease [Chitinispirillia bacterium]
MAQGFSLQAALIKAFEETALMSGISLLIAVVAGGVLGLLLYVTSNPLFIKNRLVNQSVGIIINIVRSVPFLVLLVLLIPLSKMIVHTTIGPKAVVVPLAIAATAFFARLADASFADVSKGVIEAAVSTGASKWSVVARILLPEALPSLIRNITVTAVSLIGFSAMAGTVGGGGIGDLAIRYGYQRYQTDVMLICVVLLIILVQGVQLIGDISAKMLDKK